MSWVSFICFSVVVAILASWFVPKTDFLSPGRVFGLVWMVAIGLADLKLSGYQQEWNPYSWIAIMVPISAFMLGVYCVNVLALDKHRFTKEEIRTIIKAQPIRESNLFRIIIVLFLCYAAAYVIEWFSYGVLPTFAQAPDRARTEIAMFGIHLFVNSMPALLLLIVLYFLFAQKRGRWKSGILIAVFLGVFVSFFFLLNRLAYAFFMVLAVGAAYYGSRIFSVRRALLILVPFIGILRYAQSLREVRYVENFLHVVSRMRYSVDYAEFSGPYMYIVMNLENYARGVRGVETFGFGYYTFDFLTALTGLKHWIGEYFGMSRLQFLVSGFNTFPFFWDYYLDFGLLGVVILPFALGFGVALIYLRLGQRPTIQLLVAYSVCLYVMLFSFFANMLALLNVVFPVILLIFALLLVIPAKHRAETILWSPGTHP